MPQCGSFNLNLNNLAMHVYAICEMKMSLKRRITGHRPKDQTLYLFKNDPKKIKKRATERPNHTNHLKGKGLPKDMHTRMRSVLSMTSYDPSLL